MAKAICLKTSFMFSPKSSLLTLELLLLAKDTKVMFSPKSSLASLMVEKCLLKGCLMLSP